ncbi:MAG: GGDEF domain-containing protein [Betaproteobacteria bacterium]|nr:GGDEF domain-containing protein [Betaproteobacteria bacterium]
MKLSVKNLATILIIFMGLMMVAIGVITTIDGNRMASLNNDILQRGKVTYQLSVVSENTLAIRSSEYAYLLRPRADLVKQYQVSRAKIEGAIESLRDNHRNIDEVEAAIPPLGQKAAAFFTRSQRTFTAGEEERARRANEAPNNRDADALLRAVAELEEKNLANIAKNQGQLSSLLVKAETRVIITVTACLLAIIAGAFAVRAQSREQEEYLEAMSRMAQYDNLTKLPNRVLTLDRLRQQIAGAGRSKEPFAVLAFDLDGFKKVNDTHGHAGGDDLLKQVAQRCTNALREVDTVGRMGGDEFVALLPSADREGACAAAGKLLAEVSKPYKLSNGASVFIGASIGIAVFGLHGKDSAALLTNADAASYVAKSRGKGQFVVFDTGMSVPDNVPGR